MFRLNLQPLSGTKEVMEMAREWPERADGLMRRAAYEATRKTLEGVQDRLPDEAVGLKKSLRLREVIGLKGGFGYAVMSMAVPREVEDIKPDTEILYVIPKRVAARIPPDIFVLEEYGPWTIDTLPVWPRSRYARVITRKVRAGTVARVRMERKRDKPKWDAELTRIGVRRGRRLKVEPIQKAIPDAAFESLKYEFGIGAPPKPHWRPTLIALKKGESMRSIARKVAPYLADPSNTKWRQRPTAGRVNVTKLKDIVPFQKTLGIRA